MEGVPLILVVEDDEAHAELIRRAFEVASTPFRLEVAHSLAEARAALAREPPQLVVADLRLPDGSGSELLPEDREAAPYGVIVMTSFGSEQVAVEAIKSGALDYVVKSPAALEVLPRLVGRALREWRLVAERRRAEEALRASRARLQGIIGAAMDAIVTLDMDQRILMFNPAAERMFRCTAAEAVGQSIERFIPARFRLARRAHVDEFARTGAASRAMRVGHRELLALRADGQEFPAEASISQVEDGTEKLLSVILRDITERRRAETAIRDLNQGLERRVAERTAELEAVNQQLEAFAYTVSHDLRAPLRAIDGYRGLLQRRTAGLLDEEGVRYLEAISAAATRMGRLIDDLLSFSRLGRGDMARLPVDLRALVEDAIRDLAVELSGRRVDWRITELPVVSGDGAMLRVVFTNLLSNALKFTRTREQAEIEVTCTTDARGEKIISVRDNGVGFDGTRAEKLFGVFQRLHRAEEFEGTGIGLAIVRRIVARHGGRTWAESKLGCGATVYFSLPAA